MRTKEELDSKEFNDDMSELEAALKAANLPYIIKKHLGATEANGTIKDIIGYYPTGEWHVIINDEISIIRGMTSWGLYEAYGGPFTEPERFETPADLIAQINKYNETK